jgi:hypothetical protein
MTLPWHTSGVFDVNYAYGSTGGIDDIVSRVASMTFTTPSGTTTTTTDDRIRYKYLGRAQLVGTEYPEPVANHNFYSVSGGVAAYDRLDTFNRVVTDQWTGGQGSGGQCQLRRRQSRTTATATQPAKPTASSSRAASLIYSTKYTMDDLNRVTKADRGILSGGSVSGSTRYVEDWTTLTQTGNWVRSKLDLDAEQRVHGFGRVRRDARPQRDQPDPEP